MDGFSTKSIKSLADLALGGELGVRSLSVAVGCRSLLRHPGAALWYGIEFTESVGTSKHAEGVVRSLGPPESTFLLASPRFLPSALPILRTGNVDERKIENHEIHVF